ncbi:MAG: bacteriohemerythrin [Methylococcaceae bacterium]|nr:bacteriohemerythrin [Methylococcaceae bacterium]
MKIEKKLGSSYPEISWNDDFVTGVKEIDEQHMILVNTLNEASSKLTSDNSQSVLLNFTQELLAYALYHFETEEALMQQYDYQIADQMSIQQHLKEHRSFSQQVIAVREQIHAGKNIEIPKLLDFLYQWLVNHILKTDKALAKQILAKRAGTQ